MFNMPKIVKVRFSSESSLYSYLIKEGDDIAVGDIVITSVNENIDYMSRYDNNLKAAKVVSLSNDDAEKATKYYVKHISMDELKKTRQDNKVVGEKLKKRREAIKRLDDMIMEQSRLTAYQSLKGNPEAEALINILNGEE